MPGAERGSYPAGILIGIVHSDKTVNGGDVVHVDSVTHAQEYHYRCEEEYKAGQKHVILKRVEVLKIFL